MSSRLSLHDRFGYRLSVLTRKWRAVVDLELESYGLSQATWRPLIYLAQFDEPPRQCELADALALGCPAIVRLLDQLEAKHLVERVVDGDRRANRVQLTRSGKRLATRVHDIIVGIEADLLRDLSADDRAQVMRSIDAINERIANYQPRTAKRRA
jgi:MarR family transcriptional regulator for hemolysin